MCQDLACLGYYGRTVATPFAKNRFAKRVRKARKDRGYTQKDLAEKLQCDVLTVQNWESGKFFPRADKMRNLAEALNVTVEELAEGARRAGHDDSAPGMSPEIAAVVEAMQALQESIRIAMDKLGTPKPSNVVPLRRGEAASEDPVRHQKEKRAAEKRREKEPKPPEPDENTFRFRD